MTNQIISAAPFAGTICKTCGMSEAEVVTQLVRVGPNEYREVGRGRSDLQELDVSRLGRALKGAAALGSMGLLFLGYWLFTRRSRGTDGLSGAGAGWAGDISEVRNALRVVKADRDDKGNFLISGEPVVAFMGKGPDCVVPAGATYYVNGAPRNLAQLMVSTSYGIGVTVISSSGVSGLGDASTTVFPTRSKGHLWWYKSAHDHWTREYIEGPDGDIYVAKEDMPLGAGGYRTGMRWESKGGSNHMRLLISVLAGHASRGWGILYLPRADGTYKTIAKGHTGFAEVRVPTVTDCRRLAETIMQQLGGSGNLNMMTGARDFVTLCDGLGGLQFRFPNRTGPNMVQIRLLPSDTYEVRFFRLRGREYRETGTVLGIHADQLVAVFERYTGLTLQRPQVHRIR